MASIRKRGNSWHVQIRKVGFPSLTKTFDSKDDAIRWSRAREHGLDRGEVDPSAKALKDIILADILERYLETVTSAKRSSDRERYKIAVLMRQPMSRLSLAQLTSAVLAAYRDHRLAQVQPGTVRRELAVLRHCLEVARREWGIPLNRNPVTQIAIPSAGRPRQRRLEVDDLTSFANGLEDAPWYLRPIVELAIETGMRRGELLMLRWSNIDLDRGLATLPITKNGDRRHVPLSPRAISTLVGLERLGDDVFPIKPGTVRQAWDRFTKREGLADLRFHDLRHEAISRFFEQGLSVPEVALISGHRDTKMLFRYTHLRPEDLAKKLRQSAVSATVD